MGVDIFKHLVYRTGGIPYSIWDQNTQLYTELYNNLVEHYNIRDLKSKQINKICDLVHDQIKVVETESSRKMLINFKRDLYNERPLKKQVISQILSLLPLNIASEFQNYEEYAKKEKTIKETIISQFEKTYFQDIELIKDVCNRNDFKSGLLLSSEVLYNYSKHIDEHSKINAKKALGLWKYITRASTKTTPFSTLTNINVATTVELTGTYAAITKASNKILSKIRYNNYFLESLLQILINHPQLFRSFPIVLNPTLTSKNDFLKFVTNSKNTESFQTIKKTPILEYIINTLTENPNFSVRDLEERLLMVLDKNHNRSEVSQYIFELTQTGFLNIDIDLTGLDTDWEKKIILLIEQQSDFFEKNLLINISNTLSNLEKFRKMYADGGYVDREKLKNDIKNQFDLLFKNIAESVETKNDENVTSNYIHVKAINEKKHIFLHSNSRQNNDSFKNQIYEDSSKDIELIVDKERLTTFVNDINTLINTFSPYLNLKEESSRLYDTYIDNFGDKESLPLLDFYEFLYKNDSRKKEETSNHDSSKTNDKISQIIKAEFDKGNITVANHQVNIPMDFLSHFDNKYEKTNNHKSYGGFFQFYHDDKDKLLGVASSVLLPGKGK
ncbi:MAG: lantibiotic dehydratase, partial [Bacteroidetes bacterium]|nr:lantibiotic dehydratase [Bacteroidota bacterium]